MPIFEPGYKVSFGIFKMGNIRAISLICAILCSIVTNSAIAQADNSESHQIEIRIQEVALIDLESNAPDFISLTPATPSEAGNEMDFSSAFDQNIWINYSSVTGTSEPLRKVSAYIEGNVPDGLNLNVTASSYQGNGKGKLGISEGKVELTEQATDIITGIGSCYTGNGVNNGHQLVYSLDLENADSYGKLNFNQSASISVTYTLTDVN